MRPQHIYIAYETNKKQHRIILARCKVYISRLNGHHKLKKNAWNLADNFSLGTFIKLEIGNNPQ